MNRLQIMGHVANYVNSSKFKLGFRKVYNKLHGVQRATRWFVIERDPWALWNILGWKTTAPIRHEPNTQRPAQMPLDGTFGKPEMTAVFTVADVKGLARQFARVADEAPGVTLTEEEVEAFFKRGPADTGSVEELESLWTVPPAFPATPTRPYCPTTKSRA